MIDQGYGTIANVTSLAALIPTAQKVVRPLPLLVLVRAHVDRGDPVVVAVCDPGVAR